MVEQLIRWRLFPAALQWPLVAVTAAVFVLALSPARHSEMNVGAALVWQIWWAILPFFILVTARFWCAICPYPALGSLARWLRPFPLPVPSPITRRVGAWAGVVGMALLGFLFLLLSMESNGPLTAVLLLVFASGAFATALLWRGRVWCRHLCPVGLMAGLYSRLAWLRLEPAGEPGRKAAAAGARRCPLFTSTLAARRAQDCVICADCLRVPGSEAVALRLRAPALAGPTLAPADAMAISLLLGLLFADALRMTPVYVRYMASAVPLLGGNYELSMALGIAGLVGILVLAQVALAASTGRPEPFWPFFARLSLVWLPALLAAHLALSAQHLLATGEVLRNLGAELGLVAPGHIPPADAYFFLWPLKSIQWTMLAVAGVVSVKQAQVLAGQRGRTPILLAVLPTAALLAIFGAPMSVTC